VAATARGGGRREAEKIGRSWVTVSAESGTDHNGLPRGTGLLAGAAGRAIGLTAPTSTLSAGPAAASSEMMSIRDEVAAKVPAVPATAHSTANPVGLSQADIDLPYATGPRASQVFCTKLVPKRLVINPKRFELIRTATGISVTRMDASTKMLPIGHGR